MRYKHNIQYNVVEFIPTNYMHLTVYVLIIHSFNYCVFFQTVVSFDSDITTYQRGCAKYMCTEEAKQTFICELSSYCYHCCMTSLCNTEAYKSSSCFHQISAMVEILYTSLYVLYIVILSWISVRFNLIQK